MSLRAEALNPSPSAILREWSDRRIPLRINSAKGHRSNLASPKPLQATLKGRTTLVDTE